MLSITLLSLLSELWTMDLVLFILFLFYLSFLIFILFYFSLGFHFTFLILNFSKEYDMISYMMKT